SRMDGGRAPRPVERQRLRREQLSGARRQHAAARREPRRERQDDRHDVGLRRRRAAWQPRLLRGAGQAEGAALPGDHHGLGLAGQRPVMARLAVFRWAPGEPERIRAYEVQAGADTTVPDAPVAVQRQQHPTLAVRYACRVGMCGSCAMVVNGRERWACRTLLRTLEPGPVTVRPLYHFPLIRDLVVDMAPFKDKMVTAGAAFVPSDGPPAFA